MKAGDWAVLVVVAALFGAVAWLVLPPVPRVPVETVNGTYSNPCCAPIRLSDGAVFVGGRPAGHYVIEWGRKGPRILPDTRIVVQDGRRLAVGGGSAVQWRFGGGAIELTNGQRARYTFTQAPDR